MLCLTLLGTLSLSYSVVADSTKSTEQEPNVHVSLVDGSTPYKISNKVERKVTSGSILPSHFYSLWKIFDRLRCRCYNVQNFGNGAGLSRYPLFKYGRLLIRIWLYRTYKRLLRNWVHIQLHQPTKKERSILILCIWQIDTFFYDLNLFASIKKCATRTQGVRRPRCFPPSTKPKVVLLRIN